MNILFVTNRNVDPLIGGIERITYALAKGFRAVSHTCYSLYTQENMRNSSTDDAFEGKYLLPQSEPVPYIAELLLSKQIDIIIAQGSDAQVNNLMPLLRSAVDGVQRGKLLFVFHNMPGFELVQLEWGVLCHRLMTKSNRKEALKQLGLQVLYPLLHKQLAKRLSAKYAIPYQMADKVVLLSNGYIPTYKEIIGVTESDKFVALGNALSFESIDENLLEKDKTVLLVARLEDRHKRIKSILRIWRKIEQTARFSDWKLQIVGYGPDADYYASLIQRWNLQNVSLEGFQNPIPYYQKASIFAMTSSLEGWPMTLMEAMQHKVVPMAFDSFAAIHDIVTDGEDGLIIPNNDEDLYSQKLMELMSNDVMRQSIAENSCKKCQIFSMGNTIQKWHQLFEEL